MAKEEAVETKDEAKKTKDEAKKETKEETKKETKKWSKDVKALGDKIVKLTLMQAKELGDYLKEEHGIEPASGAVMVAGPAAGGEAAVEEEKTSFDVILKEIGDRKIQVIKEVRALTSLGLKEAKAVVDASPKAVKEGVSKEEAEQARAQLEAAGAVVEIS